jgi:hypothetical protein
MLGGHGVLSHPGCGCCSSQGLQRQQHLHGNRTDRVSRWLQGGPLLVEVVGLSTSGFLLARDSSGQQYELAPDGNSLDMMRGLIRRKLPS